MSDPLRARLTALLVEMRKPVDESVFGSALGLAMYQEVTSQWADEVEAALRAAPEGTAVTKQILTRRRIEREVARMDPQLKRTSSEYQAAVVLLSLLAVKEPTADALAAFTGLPRPWVEMIVGNLRQNGIVTDEGQVAAQWCDEDGGIAFWMDVCVALGLMERKTP